MRILSGVSGTSCDGISWSLVDVRRKGEGLLFTVLKKGNSSYPPSLRNALLEAANSDTCTLSALCDMHWEVGRHLSRIASRLTPSPQAAVFSGHTVYHTEQIGSTGRGTLQIGAVEPLSVTLGIPVLSNLRSTDVAAGGMGAPLVPRADEFMFGKGSVVLNMGGIANLTLLGKRTTGFDTGPGNMLVDEAVRSLFGKEMDRGGKIAFSGRVNARLLSGLMKDGFVNAKPPKSCGRERYGRRFFAKVLSSARKAQMGDADIVATLAEFTARSITRNIELFAPGYRKLICAGGGAFNPYITGRLRDLFSGTVHMSDEFGVPADSRESIAFAIMCFLSFSLKASNSDATGAKVKLPLGSVTVNGIKRELLGSIA